MRVEAAILNGYGAMDQVRRDDLEVHRLAVFLEDAGQERVRLAAIPLDLSGVDFRRQAGAVGGQLACVGQQLAQLHEGTGDKPRAAEAAQDDAGVHEPEEAADRAESWGFSHWQAPDWIIRHCGAARNRAEQGGHAPAHKSRKRQEVTSRQPAKQRMCCTNTRTVLVVHLLCSPGTPERGAAGHG